VLHRFAHIPPYCAVPLLALGALLTAEEIRLLLFRRTAFRKGNAFWVGVDAGWIVVADAVTIGLLIILFLALEKIRAERFHAIPFLGVLAVVMVAALNMRGEWIVFRPDALEVFSLFWPTKRIPYDRMSRIGLIDDDSDSPAKPYVLDHQGRKLLHLNHFWPERAIREEFIRRGIPVDERARRRSRGRVQRVFFGTLVFVVIWSMIYVIALKAAGG